MLYNNLCIKRNYIIINALKKRLPFQALKAYIWDNNDDEFNENTKLKALFLQLLINIHLDVAP